MNRKLAYRAALARKASPHSFKWAVIEPDMFPGEDVLFISDADFVDEAQAANPGLVTYTLDEVDFLPPASDPESLKVIHRLKKRFGGWLAPASVLRA